MAPMRVIHKIVLTPILMLTAMDAAHAAEGKECVVDTLTPTQRLEAAERAEAGKPLTGDFNKALRRCADSRGWTDAMVEQAIYHSIGKLRALQFVSRSSLDAESEVRLRAFIDELPLELMQGVVRRDQDSYSELARRLNQFATNISREHKKYFIQIAVAESMARVHGAQFDAL